MIYYFTSKSKEKEIHDTISSKSNFIIIVSSGGMGGGSLLEYSHQYLNNIGFNTIKTNAERLKSTLLKSLYYSLNDNYCSCLESNGKEHSVILIDGFDAFFNKRLPFNFKLTENWIQAHLKLGHRFIVKVNSIDDKLNEFLKNCSYEIIFLNKMHTVIKKRIFDDITKECNLDIDDDIKGTILSLEFRSYRVFKNYFLFIFMAMNLEKIELSKRSVYYLYNRFLELGSSKKNQVKYFRL